MKPRVKFYIKPVYDGLFGSEARIGFYVIDKYNPDRYQIFCATVYLKLFFDKEQFEAQLYEHSKYVFRKMRELLLTLERWEEQSDFLHMVVGYEIREYPKPLAYYISDVWA